MQHIDRRRLHTARRRRDAQRLGSSPGRDGQMPYSQTIVRYTDREPAQNEYPRRIISPPRPGPCCGNQMQAIGNVQEGGRALFQYRWCPQCGFTVRRFLAQRPDPVLEAELRLFLARSFMRNVGAELWAA
jgi:hypothetical protein